jgi:1-acyl-sn-glycerol-3-phosphate acyltransferase
LFIGRFLPGGIVAVAGYWARTCLWGLRVCCGITVKVEGLEHLPPDGAVIAAQHQSALDILIWIAVLPRVCFVFKRELERIPVFGWLLAPAGMIPVNRGGRSKALRDMVAGTSKAAASGRQVLIFPEGTRMPYGVRGQVRHGIVLLANAVTVPVVPAATNSGRHWSRKAYEKTPGMVYVKLHPALPGGLPRDVFLARLNKVFYDGLPETPPETPLETK